MLNCILTLAFPAFNTESLCRYDPYLQSSSLENIHSYYCAQKSILLQTQQGDSLWTLHPCPAARSTLRRSPLRLSTLLYAASYAPFAVLYSSNTNSDHLSILLLRLSHLTHERVNEHQHPSRDSHNSSSALLLHLRSVPQTNTRRHKACIRDSVQRIRRTSCRTADISIRD